MGTRAKVCLMGRSRSVAWRFGRYLDTAVPLAVEYCRSAEEGEDELKEYCLQALESFALRSPQGAHGYFNLMFPLALDCLSYDPNYTEGMEEDGSEDEDADECAPLLPTPNNIFHALIMCRGLTG